MTQNPYAQFGQPGIGGEMLDPLDRRTSVLAILSLICGLMCFLPGPGALAAIFGGAAVIFISQSRGRLSGLGLAITGIVLGLLASIIWTAVAIGVTGAAHAANNYFCDPAARVVEAMDRGDRPAARAMFTPKADAAITDEMLDEFFAAVRADAGGLQEVPKGVFEQIWAFMTLGKRMKSAQFQGRSGFIPVLVTYDRGTAVFLFQFDESKMDQSGKKNGIDVDFKMPIINLGVFVPSGKLIWLVPEAEAFKLRKDSASDAGPTPPPAKKPARNRDAKDAGAQRAPPPGEPPSGSGSGPVPPPPTREDSPEPPDPSDPPDEPDQPGD